MPGPNGPWKQFTGIVLFNKLLSQELNRVTVNLNLTIFAMQNCETFGELPLCALPVSFAQNVLCIKQDVFVTQLYNLPQVPHA